MASKRLTDISSASTITNIGNYVIHVVDTTDFTDYSAGTSYKTSLQNIADAFSPIFTFTGGTILGPTNFVNGITATTYYGDGQYLTGIASTDNYVTGGTYSNGVLTLERQNGSVTITGFTNEYIFTGNTSGSCITNLYVHNLRGCSPITIYDDVIALGNISTVSLQITSGATPGYLLTSDINGNATWQVPPLSLTELGFTVTPTGPLVINQNVVLPENSNVTYPSPLLLGSGYTLTIPIGTTLTII